MKIIIALLMPLAIVLTVFQFIALDKGWYMKEFDKLGVYSELGRERVNAEVDNVFGYLRGGEELDEKFYTKKEILHLADVKKLFIKVKIANILAIIIFVIISALVIGKKSMKEFFKNIFLASIFSFGFFIFLFILGFLFFDPLFYLFHKISFTNNFWLLDPDTDFLVVIFTQQIFLDAFQRIVLYSFAIAISGMVIPKIIISKKSQIKT